jgi:putative addiction module component (TIGR02574 family)
MSDLRRQINSLSASEKAELLDTVWESLEEDSVSLTDAQRAELDNRIARHDKILPMSSRGSRSGRVSGAEAP